METKVTNRSRALLIAMCVELSYGSVMLLWIVFSVVLGIAIGRLSAPVKRGSESAPVKRSYESTLDDVELASKSLEYARTAEYWINRDREIVGAEERVVHENVRAAIDENIGDGAFPIYCQIPFSTYLSFKWKNRLSREIASRRQDFTVVSLSGRPIMIIEYHGSGHWLRGQELTEINDEIKRTVAGRVGIKLVEIPDGEPPAAYTKRIVDELQKFRSAGAYDYAQSVKEQALKQDCA